MKDPLKGLWKTSRKVMLNLHDHILKKIEKGKIKNSIITLTDKTFENTLKKSGVKQYTLIQTKSRYLAMYNRTLGPTIQAHIERAQKNSKHSPSGVLTESYEVRFNGSAIEHLLAIMLKRTKIKAKEDKITVKNYGKRLGSGREKMIIDATISVNDTIIKLTELNIAGLPERTHNEKALH